VWGLLAGGIGVVEREQAARGSNTPHFDAMLGNLSRLLAIAVKWGIRHAQPIALPPDTRWTHELAAAVDQAIPVAKSFSHFANATARDRGSSSRFGGDHPFFERLLILLP
jgi:hypothetical protein